MFIIIIIIWARYQLFIANLAVLNKSANSKKVEHICTIATTQ